jgi:hypothetical protein
VFLWNDLGISKIIQSVPGGSRMLHDTIGVSKSF